MDISADIVTDTPILEDAGAGFDGGGDARDFSIDRAAYRRIGPRPARIAHLKQLFKTTRDRRFEPGVVFSLRELRKLTDLSFGESRRLFLALERTGRAALIDRYVAVLRRGFPADVPLRKALNLIWATGRSEALLEYLRTHASKRLADRAMIEFYVARFVKFNDLPRTAPLLVHLVTLDPANADVRLRLVRALLAVGDHGEAARHCAAAAKIEGHRNEVRALAESILEALHDAIAADPSPETVAIVEDAYRRLEAIDPDSPHREAIRRALAIVGTPAPRRPAPTRSAQESFASIGEAVALLTSLQPKSRPHRLVSDAAAGLLRTADLSADLPALDALLLAAPKLAKVVAERFPAAADAAAGVALFHRLTGAHAAPVWTQALALAKRAGSAEDIADFAARLAAARQKTAAPQRQPIADINEAIELLTALQPGTRPHRLVSDAAASALRATDLLADPAAVDALLALSPALAETVAERFRTAADAAVGVRLFRTLAEDHQPPVWMHAARLAAWAGLPDDVAVFAAKLPSLPDVAVTDLREIARLFTPAQSAEIDRYWLAAVAHNRSDAVVPVALRSLYSVEGSTSFYPIVLGVAAGTLRPTLETRVHVEAMRLVLARSWRWTDAAPMAGAAAIPLDPGLPEEVALWTQAIFAWAGFDYVRARGLLDEGHARWPDSPTISFARDRALLAARFGKFGTVAQDLSPAGGAVVTAKSPKILREAAAAIAAAPPAHDALYPQYLIDAFFDRAPHRHYDPVPRSLVTIVGALAAGGSERQAVSVIEALSRDPRIATQSLLVRSVTPAPRAFFLPQVEASGVPFHVFEHDPADEAAALALLNEPPGSALSIALPLLPENLRTTICQLIPLLLEKRPAVVHIRQDYFAAALACVLAGVPRFFIHRGSLTPDHWDLTVPQHIATVAPMQHTYRRLVAWPGFGFINNALSGVRSDIEWTGCDDPARFSLVHNIVDFARLGPSSDPDDSVRRSIGAAPGDLVVGAAFRFHRVKRPLLWLAAARHVLTRHPEARFLMLGDGEMKTVMQDYAEAEGFADRLHLPGSVSDIGPWYRAMDVALLTSDREGLPNMLIEAQHFGVVPVSTDVGGAAETMEVGLTGLLLPADTTPEAIGDAIVGAFDDRAWFEKARATAPDFAHDRFGAKTAIDQITRLYGFADTAGPVV